MSIVPLGPDREGGVSIVPLCPDVEEGVVIVPLCPEGEWLCCIYVVLS